jgi:hypothetical protein
MFSSQSSQSPSRSTHFSSPCALDASTFSSLPLPFNFELSTARPERSRRVNVPSLSPLPATLADHWQLIENAITLSPFAAALTSLVKDKPFVCHSYKKHPGWGHIIQFKFFSFRDLTLHSLLVYPEASRRATIFPTIRTSEKRARNSRRIRTSKTQHLKPFRIRAYGKTPGGMGPHGCPTRSRCSTLNFQPPPSHQSQITRHSRLRTDFSLCASVETDSVPPAAYRQSTPTQGIALATALAPSLWSLSKC